MLEEEEDTDEPKPLKQLMSDAALAVAGAAIMEAVVEAEVGHKGGGVNTSVPTEIESCPLLPHPYGDTPSHVATEDPAQEAVE